MIEKVISGGQTGADQAGLFAAEHWQIPTGGTMPRDFMTLAGPRYDLAQRFGLIECHSPYYSVRTEINIVNSDGTIALARDFSSSGEKCTAKFTKKYNKPILKVDMMDPYDFLTIYKWIYENDIHILNVAGNSEKTAPGIGKEAFEYLKEIFQGL